MQTERKAYIKRAFFRQFKEKQIDLTVEEIYQKFSFKHEVAMQTIRVWLKNAQVSFKPPNKKTTRKIRQVWNRTISLENQKWYQEIEKLRPKKMG